MIRPLCAALLLLAPAATGRAAEVTLTVTGVPRSQGHILASLCPRPLFLSLHCPYRAKAAATAGSVTLHFANVLPGTYAAEAFQDLNDNGALDKNFIGIPREPVAFSNNAPMRFGPPSFDAAAVVVREEAVTISISLRTR